ncbi:transposase family protein [Salicibibacter halophilus]|uniref:Transposase family protein n=1 Tax=Salicibibacter halophilus TaxID=2502791 RepID=A0A514LEJ4_9BACI|nr:transposase family protein [Salicibibacter halophilus]QDI90260.1 transposase family protein [Salicibibacter halophilus]QDI91118.1 transposase family protein [Salicibibacter halophilus]QDI91376.1 transposase family protein [Salicibibacter halophilus]
MVTRKEKRELDKDANYFFEFVKIKEHFCKDLDRKLKRVKDPRHQSYVTYGPDLFLLMIIIKNASNCKSMREMSHQLNRDECIENLKKVLRLESLDEIPHYDTINDFLMNVSPEELEHIRTYIIQELLKKRSLERYRIKGGYWGVIIDGTGLFSFNEEHCDHCLRRVYTDEETGEKRTVYMHHVLEAKLMVGDMVLSIGSEFIENESKDVPKQDCELKAFYRLAEKLKETFKRLPICILGDSLYACEGVFQLCEQYRWKYILRFKEGRIQSLGDEFQAQKKLEKSTMKNVFWANDLAYQARTVNMLEGMVEEQEKQKQFLFLTNIQVNERNAKALISAGRSRWHIENQGFNHQKNHRYHIEHANSHDYQAMKNHYLLTQITDILMQLYEKGLDVLKRTRKSKKEISSNLLEAIRTRLLTDEDISHLKKPIQVRLT